MRAGSVYFLCYPTPEEADAENAAFVCGGG